MYIIDYISNIVLIGYILFFILLVYYYFINKSLDGNNHTNSFISIIIPYRNEINNIENLVQSLNQLSYSRELFEVIFVDDHSNDGTSNTLLNCNTNFIYKILNLNDDESGKKAAISKGIKNAKGEIVLTTDADCIVSKNWISKMVSPFQRYEVKLVSGLVEIKPSNSVFKIFQHIEFLYVTFAGGAMMNMGFPTMCNGANIAYRKSVFEEMDPYENNKHTPSGDDEFLMHAIYENHGKKSVYFQPNSIVKTEALDTVTKFIQQRVRWGSKWDKYTINYIKYVAIFIFLNQILFVYQLIQFLIGNFNEVYWLFGLLKVMLEICLLFMIGPQKWLFYLFNSVYVQIIYPFYVIFIGILANFMNYSWKGRKFK